jgi:hypothetical protein
MLRMERYGKTRHWAVYDGAALVVVTVYRKGAEEVLRRLQAGAPPAVAPTATPAPPRRGRARP